MGIYVAMIMFIEKKNLAISKHSQNHISHIAKADSQHTAQDLVQIAQNTEIDKEKNNENGQAEADSLSHNASSQDIISTTSPSTDTQSTSQTISPNPTTQQDSSNTLDIAQNIPQTPSTSSQTDTTLSTYPPSSNQVSKQKYGYAKYRINIRQSPDSESAIISRAAVGEALEILSDEQDGWSKVKSRFGVEGYVASRLLTQNLDAQNGEPYVVVATTLNVRSKADSQGAVIGRLSHSMRIYVLETQGEWAKIQLPNKQYGYISLNHINKSVQ